MAIFKRNRKELYGILLWLGVTVSLMGLFARSVDAFALSEAAWTDKVCKSIAERCGRPSIPISLLTRAC